MTHRGNFSKRPIAPETGRPAYKRICLAQSLDLNYKPTQTTLLVCLSRDAPCVSQAFESLRGHPSISYIWSNSLTFNPVTIIKKQQQKNKNKKHKKEKKNVSILTPITNLTSKSVKLFEIILKPLGPHLFFCRDQFTCSHTCFWGSRCDCN